MHTYAYLYSHVYACEAVCVHDGATQLPMSWSHVGAEHTSTKPARAVYHRIAGTQISAAARGVDTPRRVQLYISVGGARDQIDVRKRTNPLCDKRACARKVVCNVP